MRPLRALSLKFTKSAHKFALFQHHIPCPQKMLDARLAQGGGEGLTGKRTYACEKISETF